MIIFNEIGDCVCEMADLPYHPVAITSTCMTKLECFDKIGTHGKHNFKNKFLGMVFFSFWKKRLFITKIRSWNF